MTDSSASESPSFSASSDSEQDAYPVRSPQRVLRSTLGEARQSHSRGGFVTHDLNPHAHFPADSNVVLSFQSVRAWPLPQSKNQQRDSRSRPSQPKAAASTSVLDLFSRMDQEPSFSFAEGATELSGDSHTTDEDALSTSSDADESVGFALEPPFTPSPNPSVPMNMTELQSTSSRTKPPVGMTGSVQRKSTTHTPLKHDRPLESLLDGLCLEGVILGYLAYGVHQTPVFVGGLWASSANPRPTVDDIEQWFTVAYDADGHETYTPTIAIGERKYHVVLKTPVEIRAMSSRQLFSLFVRRMPFGFVATLHGRSPHARVAQSRVYDAIASFL